MTVAQGRKTKAGKNSDPRSKALAISTRAINFGRPAEPGGKRAGSHNPGELDGDRHRCGAERGGRDSSVRRPGVAQLAVQLGHKRQEQQQRHELAAEHDV